MNLDRDRYIAMTNIEDMGSYYLFYCPTDTLAIYMCRLHEDGYMPTIVQDANKIHCIYIPKED